MKVLIFSKDALWHGGVVNFIETLKKNLLPDIETDQFLIGKRRGGIGAILKPVTPLMDAVRLVKILLTKKYDVCHLNPSLNAHSLLRDGMFILLVWMFSSSKILVCFHGWGKSTQNAIENSIILKVLFKGVFKKSDHILVLAKPFKRWLCTIGFDESKIHLYTTMFDAEVIKDVQPSGDNENINLLFLSRFVKEKGIYELLDAFSRLSRKYGNLYLNFAGTGDEEENMHAWVRDNGLTDKVRFWGYVRDEDKAKVFGLADIFVFPTYYGEGCPVSLLEAMASGLGILTTPVGGIPDIIISSENGVLISEEVTSDDVYHGLEMLVSDPTYLNAMKVHNTKDAWNRFEASVVTRLIENYYNV